MTTTEPAVAAAATQARLRTRRPTGAIAYPTVLVEGEEKAGKTHMALSLSASPRVNRTFAFALGEVSHDEYAPLGRYEIVEHNGTFGDFYSQLRAATAEPAADGKPNAIVVDQVSSLWTLLGRWADSRARNGRRARDVLKSDPDAEIDTPMNLWNDAKDRWRAVIDLLMAYPGIAVLVARGKEVVEVEGGRPTDRRIWKVEGEKSLTWDCTAWVRLHRTPRRAEVVAVRSLYLNLDGGRALPLPDDAALEHLVFDLLQGGASEFAPPELNLPTVGVTAGQAKTRLLAAIETANPKLSKDERTAEARRFWSLGGFDGVTEITMGDMAQLLTLVGVPPDDEDAELLTDETPVVDEVAGPLGDALAALATAWWVGWPRDLSDLHERYRVLDAVQQAWIDGRMESAGLGWPDRKDRAKAQAIAALVDGVPSVAVIRRQEAAGGEQDDQDEESADEQPAKRQRASRRAS